MDFSRSPTLPLPADLRAALDALAAKADNPEVSAAARDLSAAYRERRNSAAAIRAAAHVLAYLTTRLPATFAAVESALTRLCAASPGFAPRSVLDLGCGPGTASWAATAVFDDIDSVTMVDANPGLLDAARQLAGAATDPALQEATISRSDLLSPPAGSYDLVLLSYALTELPDHRLAAAIEAAWSRCAGAMLIVEPGTPRDYARLAGLRTQLLAAGAAVAAPCPHQAPCPLVAPDWCHFSVRLARSRQHIQLKGGTLGYEDEKFSYLAVVRPDLQLMRGTARVLARPAESKFDVRLKLCQADGTVEERQVLRRDKHAHRRVRRLDWGDALDP